jgi:Arc/MetJ-type ribon-helix-helix transcriptional regulator
LSSEILTFSDEVKAIIRGAMATGRYVYEDEVFTAALYLLVQDMASKGEATEAAKAVLQQTIHEMLADLRQALDEKFGRRHAPPTIS